jgi:His-Xaa-Ser system radical SAM maturase HxsC
VSETLRNRAVLWGIPLYGHTAVLHDALVGTSGAFSDSIRGLGNLASFGQEVELRIVPTKQNLDSLHRIVSFLAFSYLSVRTISIMHLEPKGLARKNYSSLYVPVREQVPHLEAATEVGERYGLSVRLFNYPLCLLSENLRSRAVQSISDWKNYYPAACNGCRVRKECGGFFTSAIGRFLEKVEVL